MADIILNCGQTPDNDITDQITNSTLSRDVFAGTSQMRSKGKKYLPQKSSEDDTEYGTRLNLAVLLNIYEKTINYIEGQIFSKPISFDDNQEMEETDKDYWSYFKENVDNCNNNLTIFAQSCLEDSLIDGLVFCLTDTPRFDTQKNENGDIVIIHNGEALPNTKETQNKLGLEPYIVRIPVKQVLSYVVAFENGKKIVKKFKYFDFYKDGENIFYTIRTFEKDSITIEKSKDGTLIETKKFTNNFGFVPVEVLMTGKKKTEASAVPTLNDLAELNRDHYVALSDHNFLMDFARHPVWVAKGISDVSSSSPDEAINISPSCVIQGKDVDLKSVGVDAMSIEKSMADLDKKENYMRSYGVSLTQGSTTTATEANIVSSGADSAIKKWAILLQDFIERVLSNVAKIKEMSYYPSVFVNTEFRQPFDYNKAVLLQSSVEKGQITKETYLLALKSMGVLNDDFNVDDEIANIEDNAAAKIDSLALSAE